METTKYIVNNLTGQTINGASILLEYEVCTYSELYNKTVTSELTPGQWYRVTDYRSVNFLNGWQIANNNPIPTDPNFNPREIYEGEVEVILVQAISTYQIAEVGYSETFQGDIIQYQPYTNKIGVDIGGIYNGKTLPDTSIVSGFDLQWDGTNVYFNMPEGYPALFGHYFYVYCEFQGETTYYQDGNFEPLTPGIANCQYPFTSDDPSLYGGKKMSRIQVVDNGMKVILLDLTETDYDNYVTDSLYVDTVYAIGDAYGWITKRIDTQRNITAPLDFRGREYRRFEVQVLGNITGISYTTPPNPLIDGTYQVYDTSGHSPNAGFTVTVAGNVITDISIYIPAGGYFVGDTINISGTDIGGVSPDDDIIITVTSAPSLFGYYGQGDNFKDRGTTGNYKDFKVFREDGYETYNFEWNDMGGPDMNWYAGYNDNNVFLGGVYNCKIGNNFYFNTIENNFTNNNIGNNFYSNTIGNNFYYNTIGNEFKSNTIGDNFYYNTIGNNLYGNTIGDYIYNNTIGNDFYSNTIGNDFNNNTIENNFGSNTIGNNFYYNTIENNFGSNTIGNNFYFNTIGNTFNGNTIGNNFNNNTIGNNFYSNTIGNYFQYNTIGNNFYINTISEYFAYNKIGNYFNNNTIGDGFGFGYSTSQGNIIGNYFYQNTIGEYFYNNEIADGFYSNTIVDYFQLNKIKVSVSNIDFTLATHVYEYYNCEIFRKSNNELRLSLIDGLDSLFIREIDN